MESFASCLSLLLPVLSFPSLGMTAAEALEHSLFMKNDGSRPALASPPPNSFPRAGIEHYSPRQ